MAREIACGHCGGTHGSVAEVRACSHDSPMATTDEGGPPLDSPVGANSGTGRPARRNGTSPQVGSARTRPALQAPITADPAPLGPQAARLAGPPALGRSVVVAPGAEVPAPWQGCEIVKADADAATEVVERLHEAWRGRERLIIEWSGPLPSAAPVLDVAFHELSPSTELPGERLRFAVTANAVHLVGDGADFAPIRRALAAGATLCPDAEPGDVTTADGTLAFADGGPLASFADTDAAELTVIPAAHLTAGLAAPAAIATDGPSAELAPDQLAAVAHDGGPARIIAPAGSGKTRVLTERTRHLVRDRGLRPAAVSLVAYNRRARQEMAERLVDVPGLDIRTLNSLALAIATGNAPFGGGGRSLRTIGEMDARRILDRVVPGRRRRALTDPLEPWIDALSACRLGLRDPHEIEASYGADVAGFPDVVAAYRRELQRRGEIDFDEQILTALERLLREPNVLAAARAVCPVLLVDEFQDLTPAHLLLVRLLAGPAAEVFAVGDDDQTIYGYSGASPDWLVSFSRFFPGATDHPLTVNYRCPVPVVEAAVNLLSHNRHRVAKTIHPAPGRRTDGALTLAREGDPQARLVAHVEDLLGSGATPSDIAVLTRVNAALLPAALHLAEAGVAVTRPPGVDTHLLERSGVAAALAWLRLATAPEQALRSDDLALARRRPPRSVHPRIGDWVSEQRSVAQLRALAGRLNKESEANVVSEFADDIERLRSDAERGAGGGELLDTLYHEIGLLGAASQLDRSQRTARRAAHADDLAALRAVADLAPGPGELEPWVRAHLESIPSSHDDPIDAVTLATVHTTKGLEWPHVIVHDVRGDLFPHRLATEHEEERRIFHVAVTRGRESVLVNGSGPPSPFVSELSSPRPEDEPWPEPAQAAQPEKAKATKAPARKRTEPATPAEAARREALASWRGARCKSDGVPAYIVLDNATLDAIAAAGPESLVTLGRIKGIGPAKLDRYGDDILGVLADVES